jgi:hypothetical protein
MGKVQTTVGAICLATTVSRENGSSNVQITAKALLSFVFAAGSELTCPEEQICSLPEAQLCYTIQVSGAILDPFRSSFVICMKPITTAASLEQETRMTGLEFQARRR